MSVRLSALVIGVVALLATGALTYAAQSPSTSSPTVAATAPPPQTLVVPDVRGQAYVFAKGILVDAGFAWRVRGGVRGYAANLVSAQTPEPGTRVVDNGAPTLTLMLTRNRKYKQSGSPQDTAPYGGTPIRLADLASDLTPPAPPPAASTTRTTTKPKATAAALPRVTRKAEKATTAPTRTVAATAKSAYPQHRPPAFAVAGAPREPLDEMPLPDRARLLGRWLAAHPRPTDANVRHWLYQSAWVVQGAKFGWWRGAEALRLLIEVDRHAESTWRLGSKSQAVAKAALAEIDAGRG
jgi:hypothetical protein